MNGTFKNSKAYRIIITIVKIILAIVIIMFAYTKLKYEFTLSKYDIIMNDIPRNFVGYKILNIGNLEDSDYIIKIVKKEQPDLITITCDVKEENMELVNKLKSRANLVSVGNTVDESINIDGKVIEISSKECDVGEFIKEYYGKRLYKRYERVTGGNTGSEENNTLKDEIANEYIKFVGETIENRKEEKIYLVGLKSTGDAKENRQKYDSLTYGLNPQKTILVTNENDSINELIKTSNRFLISSEDDATEIGVNWYVGTEAITANRKNELSDKLTGENYQMITIMNDQTFKLKKTALEELFEIFTDNTEYVYTSDNEFDATREKIIKMNENKEKEEVFNNGK